MWDVDARREAEAIGSATYLRDDQARAMIECLGATGPDGVWYPCYRYDPATGGYVPAKEYRAAVRRGLLPDTP